MSWQLLVAISVLTYSISVLLQRVLLKDDKSDPVAYSIIFQILVGVLITIYAFIHGFQIPNLMPIIPNLILMTILYGAGNVFIFNALKLIQASEFTIIFTSRSLWTIIAAVLFLGERFTTQQVFGTTLIISSVVMVTGGLKLKTLKNGHAYALLAGLAFGLAFANDAFILRNFDVPSYLSLAFIIPALAVLAIKPGSIQKMKPLLEKAKLAKLLLLGIFYAISAITVFLAYQVGRNAAQIAPLNQTSTIITVLFGIIFLKESAQLAKKLVGTIVSFIGVLLLK